MDMNQRMAQHKQIATEEGLAFGDRKKTYNSRLAQELGKWAEENSKGDAYHRAVFHAYFAEGQNIGAIAVLLDLVERIGLPPVEAQKILESRKFRHVVDMDWGRSYALGVTAVPTFFMGRQSLVGAQPYHILERFVASIIAR